MYRHPLKIIEETLQFMNVRQKMFVQFYCGGDSGTTAARKAGYSESSARNWSLIARASKIAAAIETETNKQIELNKKKLPNIAATEQLISFETKCEKLAQIIHNVVSDSGILYKQLPSAIAAIAELNKMQGHYSAEKRINLNVDIDEDLAQVKELLAHRIGKNISEGQAPDRGGIPSTNSNNS
jgi:hypothetical protein